MFAANTDLEFRTSLAALLDAPTHQRAYTLGVECLKRTGSKNPRFLLAQIVGQEAPRIIAQKPHGGRGEIVVSKREDPRAFGVLPRHERGPRQLNHRPDKVVQ